METAAICDWLDNAIPIYIDAGGAVVAPRPRAIFG